MLTEKEAARAARYEERLVSLNPLPLSFRKALFKVEEVLVAEEGLWMIEIDAETAGNVFKDLLEGAEEAQKQADTLLWSVRTIDTLRQLWMREDEIRGLGLGFYEEAFKAWDAVEDPEDAREMMQAAIHLGPVIKEVWEIMPASYRETLTEHIHAKACLNYVLFPAQQGQLSAESFREKILADFKKAGTDFEGK